MVLLTVAALFSFIYLLNDGVSGQTCGNVSSFGTQLDTMLAEYEREAPPPGQPVRLRVTLDVRHVYLDERASTMRLQGDLHLSWVDSRLQWNASDWGCGTALVSAERLWTPDVTLLNAAADDSSDAPLRARLTSDGAVAWAMRLDVSVYVTLNMDAWPNDAHTAVFIFGCREYTDNEVDIIGDDFQYMAVSASGVWELKSVHVGNAVRWREGSHGHGWAVEAARRAPAHALAATGVLTAAALLLLAAGSLPPASRHPLCACAAITASIWLMSAAARVPAAASCPRVLRAACGVCAVSAAAALCAALVSRVAALTVPPPRAVRSLVAAASTSVFCNLAPQEGGGGSSGTWAAAAQLLDNTLRALLALALLVSLCLLL